MLDDPIHRAIESLLSLKRNLRARWSGGKRACKHLGEWMWFEGDGRAPEAWPGWPNDKEFAFVLTHDVLGPTGLSRCRQLAEIEMEHGFRSSFYFQVSNEFEVPADLLNWLRTNGFEIGVRHSGVGRRHFDGAGKLKTPAEIVNPRLKAWGAHGFRAGDAPWNLDLLGDLEIEYDASAWDFDPLRRGRKCVQTVFPFWVSTPDPAADSLRGARPNGHHRAKSLGPISGKASKVCDGGYVELPSTMLTDHDLFLTLRECGSDIWLKKLRWLADKRALSTLITHPDYMCMPGQARQRAEYPVEFYGEFLAQVRSEYGSRFWPALPREVAAYCRKFRPRQARPKRYVVMVSYSFYKYDNRVRRYAETLARRGDRVQVFCMGPEEQVRSKRPEILNGVEIRALQYRPPRAVSKWTHAVRLIRFFWRVQSILKPGELKGRCDLLHIHNVPDFLVFAGWRLKMRGTPIILDIHDLVPELFESKFQGGRASIIVRVLRAIEKWSCKFSDHVLVANHVWKQTLTGRSADYSKVTALVNYVDLDLFRRMPRTRSNDRIVLLYPGSLHYHQGLDLAIDAVKALSSEIPNIDLHIHGDGAKMPELKRQIRNLGLTERVRFFSTVPLHQVPVLMADADIGIVPKRAEGFGGQAYSTKIMEFMSQALPVVLSRTPIDSIYFDDSVVAYFESGNSQDMARAIRQVVTNRDYRERLSKEGFAYATANSWQRMKRVYLDLVDRLTMTAVV